MNPRLIVILVLIALSLVLAVMDRSFLSPMYLLVLALVVMVGTSVKFPWLAEASPPARGSEGA